MDNTQQHNDRLSLVCRYTTDVVMLLDREGRIEWINDAFTRRSFYTREEVCGRRPIDICLGPDTDPATVRAIQASFARGEGFATEMICYTRFGEARWMSINCTASRNESAELTGFLAVCTDITDKKQAEAAARQEAEERRKSEALLRDVLDALPSAVTVYDADDRFVLCNAAYEEMFPITARIARQGHTLARTLEMAAAAGQYPDAGTTPQQQAAWAAACAAEHHTPGPAAWIVRTTDGRFVQSRQRRSESGNLVCVRTDTTDLMRAQAELRAQADRDCLTHIANRATLVRTLENTLNGQRGGSDGAGALVLFDLDDFKQVNDRFGHDVGDALLIEISQRLRGQIRAGDIAARLGGDEFAIMMPGLDIQSLPARMDRIHAALSQPAHIGQLCLNLSVSAGVAMFPADGAAPERLLKHADMALYDAKRAAGGQWRRFRPEQAQAQTRRARQSDALREAIEQRAINVALQPKRKLLGGHAGFEALARWFDGERWVPPAEFVPLADEIGLGGVLGRLVMDTALTRLVALRKLGLSPGSVAVNVTRRQILDAGFAAATLALLRSHGLAPGDLELELTETMLLGRKGDRVARVLRQLKAQGVTLALDDFGTGFASLPHLSNLHVDRLKIDRSFVTGIGTAGLGGVMTRTVIRLARGLDIESIAEGVETAAQMAFLQAEGCDAVQGYIVAHPMLSLDEAATYLRAQAQAGMAAA